MNKITANDSEQVDKDKYEENQDDFVHFEQKCALCNSSTFK